MATSSTALVAISRRRTRNRSVRFFAILSIDETRSVRSPTSLCSKKAIGSRSSRDTPSLYPMTEIRVASRLRNRCLRRARRYARTPAPRRIATSPPQGAPFPRTSSTKTPRDTGTVSASRDSMSTQAMTPASTPPDPARTVRSWLKSPGVSPPGLKSAPGRNRSAIPLYPLSNSSAVSLRRPVEGSFR